MEFKVVHTELGFIHEKSLPSLEQAISHLFWIFSEYEIQSTGFYQVAHYNENEKYIVDFKIAGSKVLKLDLKTLYAIL